MPTVLGPRFDPSYEGPPVHASPEDLGIWQRWRRGILDQAINLYFDVGLGEGGELPPILDPKMAKMWLKNTQKRADVVVETKTEVWIVELRHYATANCVGRVLMYDLLWRTDPVIDKPVKNFIITDSYDKEVEELSRVYGIEYDVV